MLRRDSLFGHLRPGYYAILIFTAFYLGVGVNLGGWGLAQVLDWRAVPYAMAGWLFPALLWLAVLAIEVTRRQVEFPTRAMLRLINQNRHWIARGIIFSVATIFISKSFGSIKVAIPNNNPFYADLFFIEMDRFIFGTDPWRLTHSVLGEIPTVVIDRIYLLWFTQILLLIGYLNFTRNKGLQVRGLMTYFLTAFINGSVLATLLSSVGPCFVEVFYGNGHFRPLMETLHQYDKEHTLGAVKAMEWLRQKQGTETFGAGISAMPSLHVSLSYLSFLVTLAATRRLWLRLLVGLYALAILVGSVHLGWHYAVDGLLAILVVTLIWIGAGSFVSWLERRAILSGKVHGPVSPQAIPDPV